MLSKEEFIVLRHYVKEGLTKTAIAKTLGINRRTVHRHLSDGKEEPEYGPRPPRPSKLDHYKGYLMGRIETYPELSAQRLLSEIRSLGYQGGYTTLKDYLRVKRPKHPLTIEQRFEVAKGQQAQVDFATFKTPFGTVYALLVVLSWSRVLWVRFGFHQDQLTLLRGMHQAFGAFGGVPRTVLFAPPGYPE
jgi:transposase